MPMERGREAQRLKLLLGDSGRRLAPTRDEGVDGVPQSRTLQSRGRWPRLRAPGRTAASAGAVSRDANFVSRAKLSIASPRKLRVAFDHPGRVICGRRQPIRPERQDW